MAEPPPRYHRDPMGRLLWRVAGPPARQRVRTTQAFEPPAAGRPMDPVAEFERRQRAVRR
jgi:hypothetical protein